MSDGLDGPIIFKDKYKVKWCSLCNCYSINCLIDKCRGSSCNGGGCDQCSKDFDEFNEVTGVTDYLTDEEIKTLHKINRLRDHLIPDMIKLGDKEINWKKFNDLGNLCKNDETMFADLIAAENEKIT
jgi:hypothetical protein